MDSNQEEYLLKLSLVKETFQEKIDKMTDKIEEDTEIKERNMFKNNKVLKTNILFKVNIFLFRAQKE